MSTIVQQEIRVEDVQRKVCDQLGSAYQVMATSSSAVMVTRNPLSCATGPAIPPADRSVPLPGHVSPNLGDSR